MATKSEATIPKLAPAPTTLLAHAQPMFRKAIENDASFSIYNHSKNALLYIKISRLYIISASSN